MAESRVQREAEAWIVANELSKVYGQQFSKRKVTLAWGGSFEFDGVSDDGKTIVCVSTSRCQTAGGRPASGKFKKILSDALYLLNAVDVERRVLAFIDKGMVAHFERERQAGRFPLEQQVELRLVTLPTQLAAKLEAAVKLASIEVSPKA